MNGRLFRMLYLASNRDLRLSIDHRQRRVKEARPLETQLHKIRDGLSSSYLAQACTEAGFRPPPGHDILNLPKAAREHLEAEGRLTPTSQPEGFRASDLLLLSTRPPMDDHGAFEQDEVQNHDELFDDKRWIARSGLELERQVFRSLRPFLAVCTRTSIAIQREVELDEDAKVFRELIFYSSKGGRIRYARSEGERGSPNRITFRSARSLTMGYLVAVPVVPEARCRFLGAWGPGGTETLVLAQLLVGQLRSVLDSALSTTAPSMWLIPFQTPRLVPSPFLRFYEVDLASGPGEAIRALGPFR